ncbi:MAG TPA: protease modulator HflK [Verrucomicrobiae bacterium]|jgi:membrane protease subunit HflK
MDKNVQKNAVVNLLAAVLVFIAAFGVTVYAGSLAGEVALIFLGLAVLIAFISWFQMRLEENEQLERLEVEEMARAKGEAGLFESKESELFPARRAKEQFERFFVPSFAVLLFLLEAGGGFVLWHWSAITTMALSPDKAMAAVALFSILALLLFLLGRFSATIARLENHRLLRPGSNFILAGAYLCAFTAVAIAGDKTGFPRADFWMARAFCILYGLMAAEMLVTLLLEIYRPRVKGKITRPLYDSRLIGLLGQPESLFTTAAQALDYQFGFKVSETWFYQLLEKNLSMFVLAQMVVLFLSTCVVFVDAGEQAVLEHFGNPVATLEAGGHLKLPWPIDKIYRYRTDQIQSLYVGYTPETNEQSVMLWTVAHNKEENFLVGNRALETGQNDNTDTNDSVKTPPVNLITISIPVQFQITNVMDWAYKNSNPTNLLEELATRAVVRYLAGMDLDDVMGLGRLDAAGELRDAIQTAANERELGTKIIFVGLQDIHPPTPVASSYEQVINAAEERVATTENAIAYANTNRILTEAEAFATKQTAQATRLQLETAALAQAALFSNQIPEFAASPSVYEQRVYFQTFANATRNARKYVLLETNMQDQYWLDLEQKIRNDLENIPVNE